MTCVSLSVPSVKWACREVKALSRCECYWRHLDGHLALISFPLVSDSACLCFLASLSSSASGMRKVLWGLSGSCTETGEFLAPPHTSLLHVSPSWQADLASFSPAPFPLRTQPPVPLLRACPSPSIQPPLDRFGHCHRRYLCRPQRHLPRAGKMQFEMHDNVKGKGGITG